MPTYEYRCETNGRVVEVSHKMAERLSTWGELCERAGIARGKTVANAPVTKLMSAGFVNSGNAAEPSRCQSDRPCGGGVCGVN